VSDLVNAAVLVPVFRDGDGALRLVLVVRARHGLHGGQLGFPGGRAEPGDGTMLETALREAEEEIGLARADVEVVAELEPLVLTVTRYLVHPFLARIPVGRRWRLQPGEVDGVVTPRLDDLLAAEARVERELHEPAWPAPRRVPGVPVEGHYLWGFSLRLLDVLAPRLLAGEWEL
jgi:8-oxo-dGTP pyrophosphatase MutT (NUDIX family)